ncbi:MAG: NIPSNAP family protein [Candidatus Tectomicrobia bacterium]|nr:NIPSNAP family protein [Candidatus Tectomicrobia bacterium]
MIYLHYTDSIIPGKMGEFLESGFLKELFQNLESYGAKTVGMWRTQIGPSYDLIWILAYESLAERERVLSSIRRDSAYQALIRRVPEFLVSRMIKILQLVEYSPGPAMPSGQEGIYLHRTISVIPTKLRDHHEFSKALIPITEKHGEKLLGTWRTMVGPSAEIIRLSYHESLGRFEEERRAILADPDYQALEQLYRPETLWTGFTDRILQSIEFQGLPVKEPIYTWAEEGVTRFSI